MMPWCRLFQVYILLVFLHYPASAQNCQSTTKLYYINGITYGDEQADDEKRALEPIIEQMASQPKCYEKPQLKFQTNMDFLTKLRNAANMDFDTAFQRIVEGPHTSRADFGKIVMSVLIEQDLYSYVIDRDLRQFVIDFKRDIEQGHDVVVIAHSVGNLYAKLAEDRLTPQEQQHFRVISVGLPVPPWEQIHSVQVGYTNLEGDFIELLDSAPPANVNNSGGCGSDWECHNFVHSYLKGDMSKRSIVDDLSEALAALPVIKRSGSSVRCTAGDLVRRVEIRIDDPSRGAPCEVIYWKGGEMSIEAQASNTPSVCENTALQIKQNLKQGGFVCEEEP